MVGQCHEPTPYLTTFPVTFFSEPRLLATEVFPHTEDCTPIPTASTRLSQRPFQPTHSAATRTVALTRKLCPGAPAFFGLFATSPRLQ